MKFYIYLCKIFEKWTFRLFSLSLSRGVVIRGKLIVKTNVTIRLSLTVRAWHFRWFGSKVCQRDTEIVRFQTVSNERKISKTNITSGMKDRIRQLMESQHMNQQSFASFVGIAPATLSSILQERTRPTLATVESVQKKFPNINLTWLINGNGPMFIEDKESIDNRAREGADATSDQDRGAGTQPGLFDFSYDTPDASAAVPRQQSPNRQAGSGRQQMQQSYSDVKTFDKPSRKITEIRVFFDDQTWESFVPKK